MSFELYYPIDILNALRAANQAVVLTATAGDVDQSYLSGYLAALTVIAVAFGIPVEKDRRGQLRTTPFNVLTLTLA